MPRVALFDADTDTVSNWTHLCVDRRILFQKTALSLIIFADCRTDMEDSAFPNWQLYYLDAVAPGSAETLPARVADAEKAILSRLERLVRLPERRTEEEAIRQALDALYVIKRDKLDFPDWRVTQPEPV
jgi:hypothetical protein